MKTKTYPSFPHKVTADYKLWEELYNITPIIQRIHEELHPKIMKGHPSALKKLGPLIEQYPETPLFTNL